MDTAAQNKLAEYGDTATEKLERGYLTQLCPSCSTFLPSRVGCREGPQPLHDATFAKRSIGKGERKPAGVGGHEGPRLTKEELDPEAETTTTLLVGELWPGPRDSSQAEPRDGCVEEKDGVTEDLSVRQVVLSGAMRAGRGPTRTRRLIRRSLDAEMRREWE
uniref:Uncharacterized protein n=2 Tax=Oryza TaxID=4527 RepID=A0A0D3HCY2_9ORYZ